MKKSAILYLVVLALLSACNTVKGVGQDIQGAGEWTAESAQKAKQKMSQ